MKIKNALRLLVLAFSMPVLANEPMIETPNGFSQEEGQWLLQNQYSDNFSQDTLDNDKWENAPKSLNVGAWTFAQANAFVDDGKLKIMATQETHTRPFHDSCWDGKAGGSAKTVDRTLHYKSGAVRTRVEGVYGFYEASIKGVKVFPGLSPAFWLYSDNHPYEDRTDKTKQYVDYTEIDIVELQQADWRSPTDIDDVYDMDHNLHARVEENGRIVWKRPKPNKATQLLHYRAPFDPSEGFHTYAVENRKDRIFWYVDGVLVGSKANTWWHRPMHMIFSMGLRRHFIKYNPACQRADPHPKNIISEGFPEDATMEIEYARMWKAQPSIWLIDNQPNIKISDEPLSVTIGYHGGSDSHIVSDNKQGLVLELIEKGPNGFSKVVTRASERSVAEDENKRYGGEQTLELVISDLKASAKLEQGHYYQLAAGFKVSTGEQVQLKSTEKLHLFH